ncbi:XrtB/PEP-CTERM-associated polysaccharide biosynthesis outer membrane protein EpsL [Thiobacillus denitrificans]|uniref:XrtB/PEP-CTERM-associated polysaccharide biosynthesis outer membrane protein EpsL n=1 Tax=Thiobacillus denitrificans TaxID=36861 RepID=UPI001EDAEBEC|nr:XrtB/PEP-CTERM-associated polysaccharide biosynthesis outer membrane protein EpsL [Thiobacillus denitrificans]
MLGALLALPAQAKEGDTFRPFVSYTRNYDSNLFRLAESEYALVPQRSDQYGVLSAGLNMDWQPGRQRIIASASKNQVRFARNTQLDYDGSDYQLKWNWRLGNHWSGQVGATESVTQSSFSDLVGLRINNQITRDNRFASADWQFHPRWNVGLGAAAATLTNSTVQQAPLDYEDQSVSATLGYATPKGSKLRGQMLRVEGEYPHRLPNTFVDRTYTQTEYNLLGDWNVTGKVVAHAKAGYVKRENDTLAQRDFSGLAGRLSADYFPTGKTALNWALYREIANSDDLNATYQLNTGTSLGAAWRATEKITLRAGATFENRSFQGDTGLVVPGLQQRDEDTLGGSLSMRYAPVRMAIIDVGLLAGRRDSNMTANDYNFHGAFVSVRADF